MDLQPFRGVVPIQIGGATLSLCYSHSALDRLVGEYGKDPLQAIAPGLDVYDTETVCKVLSAGLIDQYEELTWERIHELSPPILPAIAVIEKALDLSVNGPDDARQAVAQARPPRSLLTRLLAWSGLSSTPSSSGSPSA